MMFEILVFVLPFLISFVLGLFIIPRMKVMTTPVANNTETLIVENRKNTTKHLQIGGFPVFPLLLVSVCVTLAMPKLLGFSDISVWVQASAMRILQIISGLAIMYVAGVKSDLHGTSSQTMFWTLLCVACMFPASGLWINDLHGLLWIHELPMWAGIPFTVFLAMYLTEMFKLFDGIDGLESGLSAVALIIFLLFSLWAHFIIASIIASAALGLVLPYWAMKAWSKSSRKTVLGSSGSYCLGYVIAYLTIGLTRQGGDTLPEGMFIICLSVVLLPALDIMRVLLSRIRDSRALLAPDKNQLNHKLLRTGMGRAWIIVSILCFTFIAVGVTSFLVFHDINPTYIFIVDIILYVFMHYVLNYFIHKAENKAYHRSWNKVYGEEAWNADIPEDTLREKVQTFGTMGLPAHIIEGNDVAFISDGMNLLECKLKRIFDFGMSAVCLIVFSPLFLLTYILIKLDDGGPVIYTQERIGRFGRPFKMLKYRSMRLDAEKDGPALSHPAGIDDPRLTKVGKFIRAHHLDELPQLWNVFKGEMSFIGYRPERQFFIEQIMQNDPRYAFLYQIRPGITSYATLYNGYTDTMEKMLRRLELDLYYLGHRSWWLDVKVLAMTFLSIVSGKKF